MGNGKAGGTWLHGWSMVKQVGQGVGLGNGDGLWNNSWGMVNWVQGYNRAGGSSSRHLKGLPMNVWH